MRHAHDAAASARQRLPDRTTAIETVPSSCDVDLGAGLFLDGADHLAAGADDRADLLGIDLDRGDARRERARARSRGAAIVSSILPRMKMRPSWAWSSACAHDLGRDALDLDVHLDRGDALRGAGDLEVHVAERVLHALDVGQDRVAAGCRHR